MTTDDRKRLDIMDASDEDNDRNADWIKTARARHIEQLKAEELAETGRLDSWDAVPEPE